jgi:4-amino-4-deoxy-L-arabinose transferase-like glycosyltransferase
VDEAIYATVGKEALAGHDLQAATSWIFGSSFYPMAAALSSRVAGVVGLRGLSAILSTVAALFMFLAAWRLFNIKSALWALFIFGITGSSINIGQFATYDVMALPFLAITLYCIVSAAVTDDEQHETTYLLVGGLMFSLSFLAKYIALIYLPTFMVIGVALFIRERKPVRPLFDRFLIVAAVIIGAYIFFFLSDLIQVLSGKTATQIIDRLIILRLIVEENGLAFVLAAVGAGFAAWALMSHTTTVTGRTKFLVPVVVFIVLVSTMALPLYHLVSSNVRALEKHCVYALIFVAPLAGYGVASLINKAQQAHHERIKMIGSVVTIATLVWFTNYSLDRNWGFQNSWPNVSHVIDYLREKGVNQHSLILAAGANVYEYYFDFDIWSSRSVWYSTWYMSYKGATGVDAMKKAIADHAVNYVVLDDYYTPEMNPVLEPVLQAAGYRQDWQENLESGSGDTIRVRVFVPPTEGGQP